MPKTFQAALQKSLSMPLAAVLVVDASALALAFVFIMQYVFGYQPCILCLWQRLPYAAAFVLSAVAIFRPHGRRTELLLGLCALAFFISAGLATFHTGVERHWWLGTAGCHITPLHGASVEDMRLRLLHTVMAHCDEISWTFLGLSMANWNLPASLVLCAFSALAALKAKKAA